MTMRDGFEAHMRKTTLSNCERLADGDYLNHHIQHGWDIWQAATKKEREACAAICDEWKEAYEGAEPFQALTAEQCAAAIRGMGQAEGPAS